MMKPSILSLALAALAVSLAVPACAQTPDAIAAGTFAYDRAAPLNLRDSLETTDGGVEVRAVSFDSPRGGRVTGLLYVPSRVGRKAGVVFMHGAPGSARSAAAHAMGVARHNAVVLAIDAPFARRGDPPLSFTPADSADQVQLVVDLQRAVDVLLARADVDPARIAFVGGSFGAAVGTMYASVDPRPATYVLFVPDGGMVHHFTAENGERDPQMEIPDDVWNRWAAAGRPVEGIRYIGRVRPGTILFQNGRSDQAVKPYLAQALHRAAGASHTVRWYDSGHALPRQARVDRYQWLHEKVGTDAPTPEERAEAAAEPAASTPRPAPASR